MILIQSRLASRRLPRKSEKKILGISLIERVVKQCLAADNHHTVLCIPSSEKSEPIYSSISAKFPELFFSFGPAFNVAERLQRAFREFRGLFEDEPPGSGLVRVCGDRPFLSSALLADTTHQEPKSLELLYNHLPQQDLSRPGPRGLGIESLSRALADKLFFGELRPWLHREHVTANLYNNRRVKKSHHLAHGQEKWWRDLSGEKFDVDSDQDLHRLNTLSPSTLLSLKKGRCL